ncbi:hypothetical protein F3Y22_tig00111780pilonHSYRG00014 [Hibiscus syriacus]|uniref:Uncharacterized protein n=1 Tax=Hibiscus syriacus TaxID=106335 RepID=A0A6A2Y0J8_HIBSY|nr:hypothetical protein F3Y22_tig00111780pilonHSYRG00014 [Hibiscus syriacus]
MELGVSDRYFKGNEESEQSVDSGFEFQRLVDSVLGKKHRRNLQEKISSSIAVLESSNAMILGASSVVNAQELERKKQKLLNSGAAVNSVRMCTICNVACKSFEVFAKHLSGRRHPAQAGLIAVMALDLISLRSELMITLGIKARRQRRSFNLLEPSSGSTAQSIKREDLETKKRKVMEGGAAAAAVRVCTICNVVCNSQKVFDFHLTRQKHAAMVKRQADARIATATTT